MAKMTLELGGKYTAGQTFNKAVGDIKQFGKETRQVSQVATNAFGKIAEVADGRMTDAINGVSSVVKGFATGGIWGMLAGVATFAIGKIVEAWKEAKEQAKKYTEYMSEKFVTSIKKVNDEFEQTKQEIDEVKQEAEDALAVLSGKTARDMANAVYRIHTEALQKVTDDMTEKGKAVVEAEEKLAIAEAKSAIMYWDNAGKVKVAKDKVALSDEKVAEANDALECHR